jgi:5S rRNA maturation endonuclease (ribonuclease M5)
MVGTLMPEPLPPEIDCQLSGIKAVGDQWIARCTVHEDNNPSLTLKMVEGKLLVHCHAGCDPKLILDSLGYQPPKRPDGFSAIYDYRDEAGTLLFQVCRTPDKRFLQRRPDPSRPGEYIYKLENTRRVLYRLSELIRSVRDGKSVCIAEGERDVESLVSLGCTATCNPGGAGKWRKEYAEFFEGAQVTIFADKDEPGRTHAREIAASIDGIAAHWRIVEAADPHKDITAQLGAGLPPSAVVEIDRSDKAHPVDLAPDLYEFLAMDDGEEEYDWAIPDLLERGERLIVTGEEGGGKTTFLRLLGVLPGHGVHPTKLTKMKPISVLFIDCENREKLNRHKLAPIVVATRRIGTYTEGSVRLIHRTDGLELETEEDRAWLRERVRAHKPDLLIIGPLYKLHTANPKDEEIARAVTRVLDTIREENNCAIVLEAHAPNEEEGRIRSLRPLGSSLYRRWTDYGIGMRVPRGAKDKDYAQLVHWRGPRDERPWPVLLHRAIGGIPWEAADWEQYRAHNQDSGLHAVEKEE